MSTFDRNLNILNKKRIVYKQDPINDIPDSNTSTYMFFEEGTFECYDLFRSKAKINTYRSLKWHLLVLWYLNPSLDQDEFLEVAEIISNKVNGFVSFNIPPDLLRKIIYEVSMADLDTPPKNKRRKVIFKQGCGLNRIEKLRIVGELIGRSNKIDSGDVYMCMIDLHDANEKITIKRVSELLGVSQRTIHRYMPEELKREKELLNKEL